MGFTSIWHWIIVLAVVLILFARPGKISGLMGDFGKGLKNFKDGVKGDEDDGNEASDAEVIEEAPKPKKKAAKKAAPKKKAAKKAAKKSAKKSAKKAAKKS